MKTSILLLFIFGVWVVSVVTCAPRPMNGPLPLRAPCTTICPDDYRPVCAVNALGESKTFSNRCFLDTAYCKERQYWAPMKEGEC